MLFSARKQTLVLVAARKSRCAEQATFGRGGLNSHGGVVSRSAEEIHPSFDMAAILMPGAVLNR
jgi:hypothetical protein